MTPDGLRAEARAEAICCPTNVAFVCVRVLRRVLPFGGEADEASKLLDQVGKLVVEPPERACAVDGSHLLLHDRGCESRRGRLGVRLIHRARLSPVGCASVPG